MTQITASTDIKPGDYIYAKPVCRWPTRWAWRKVTGFYQGRPTVNANGCGDFVIKRAEIRDVRPAR